MLTGPYDGVFVQRLPEVITKGFKGNLHRLWLILLCNVLLEKHKNTH